MGHRIPIPLDFREMAQKCTSPELAVRYGISENLIRQWRRELGIPPLNRKPPKKIKGGSAYLITIGQYTGSDTATQIALCLNCRLGECNGNCLLLKDAKHRERKHGGEPGHTGRQGEEAP